VDQTCSPAERAISAFKNGASVNALANMLGRTPGSVEWLLKKNGLNKLDHLGMMKNDTLGDCTCAAIGHMIQTWTSQTTGEAVIPDWQIVELYEHACGYDPSDPDSDQGGVEIDVLNYWRRNPVDGPNGPHSLDAFAAVARRHHADIKDAVWLFGGAYIGVALPLSAQSSRSCRTAWAAIRCSACSPPSTPPTNGSRCSRGWAATRPRACRHARSFCSPAVRAASGRACPPT
jgi:hypothetical protein